MSSEVRKDESEIRNIFDNWAAAVRREDMDGIRANHSPEIIMFDVPPPLLSRGIDAYMQTWQTFFRSQARPIVFDFGDVQITAGEQVAFATAIGRCVYIEPSGEHTNLEFRLTMCFRKLDGEWWITHEHHSVPATD
jgi:uncharacterized protein (TIGR02246 family)